MLNDKRIKACISRYDNGAYSRMQFLTAVSHSIPWMLTQRHYDYLQTAAAATRMKRMRHQRQRQSRRNRQRQLQQCLFALKGKYKKILTNKVRSTIFWESESHRNFKW